MPVFHTKTIESILEPVAQQVSRLVILHEEAEDGNAMPDLEQPVKVVSNAVQNLIKVGKETINGSGDEILRQDMPTALIRVEKSSKLLEEASAMLKQDPYSGPARKKLIDGSGGILQATSALLLCFDESEVRKIIQECKRVLDYLAVAEVIETMEELVQFLRDLSPCLSKVTREVSAREKELTHQVHAEILVRCLEQVKTLAPILICSMKIYIHIIMQGGKGAEEAAENRNYLARRMSDEINEIIRVLQLTSYDEDQSELDNLTVLKKLQNVIQNKINNANDWLTDPHAVKGGLGEKSLRQIVEAAQKVAERCLPKDAHEIRRLCSEITTMTDALCELRQDGKGATPQAESLARSIRDKLGQLQQAVLNAVVAVDKTGLQQAAHTVQGRLEQARKWLSNPAHDDKGLGQRAIALIVDEGKKVAEGLPGIQKAEILQLCDEVESLSNQLANLCAQGRGDTPQAHEIARKLSQKLNELKERISATVTNRVVEDFIDIVTPLKQFTDAVLAPEGTPNRDQNFSDKAAALQQFSNRAVKTAKMVAAGGSGGNKKLAEALQNVANQVESLTPQLVSAGSIRLNYPTSKAADEHFENLRQQYADTLHKVRDLCDEATNSGDFIKASEEQMKKHTFLCEEAIKNKQPQKMVDNTSAIARLTKRVLQVAKQECDNSEDPHFIHELQAASDTLLNSVPVMVQDAKQVAINPSDHAAVSRWRESNRGLLNAVGQVRRAVQPDVPPLPDINNLHLVGEPLRNTPTPGGESGRLTPHSPHQYGRVSPLPKWAREENPDLLYQELSNNNLEQESAPPRPPPPMEDGIAPMRPPPPETDDEDDVFKHAPSSSQPIMVAAHNLHREVRQWSAKDNELIAAARKMALLMARLSELVHNDDKGSKRELIATAKAIAEASADVTRIAKQLARECTDKRIRTNLLQVCERIPTIATQLKILSTVKATMLGAQGEFLNKSLLYVLV
ncbi:vinculin isoform X2 [Agrilus planipennis]|uniref:Vinculin n=1 Tax=Agrilus planipennis TaxID=224129 RepID=A0A7F5RE89_AGRPL|nr:vinculin isoform X2 [Agrilus planipennis]